MRECRVWLVCVGVLASSAMAQQKPRVAVLPLDAASLTKPQRTRLSDVLYGAVAGLGAVTLAPTSDVQGEYERKYQGACPANEVHKCLAYLAEHTNATYALRVELRRGARAKSYEWVATVAAFDGSIPKQASGFTFVDSGGIVFDRLLEDTLKRYVVMLELQKLPAVPMKAAATASDAPKVTPPNPLTTVPKSGTPPGVVKPVEANPMKTVGWIVAGTGVAVAAVGGIMYGIASGEADRVGRTPEGNVPAGNAQEARAAADQARVGSILAGAGAVVAVGGLVLALTSDDGPAPRVMVTPISEGAVVSISGVLP